jgi:hypothetical protein
MTISLDIQRLRDVFLPSAQLRTGEHTTYIAAVALAAEVQALLGAGQRSACFRARAADRGISDATAAATSATATAFFRLP